MKELAAHGHIIYAQEEIKHLKPKLPYIVLGTGKSVFLRKINKPGRSFAVPFLKNVLMVEMKH